MQSIAVLAFTLFTLVAPTLAQAEDGYVFVGCRPSAGECIYSCPERNGAKFVESEECSSFDDREPFACYCAVEPEAEGGDEPPPY